MLPSFRRMQSPCVFGHSCRRQTRRGAHRTLKLSQRNRRL